MPFGPPPDSCQNPTNNIISWKHTSAAVSFVIQVVDIANKILDRTAPGTIIPLPSISNAAYLICKPDGATLCHIVLLTPLNTRSKQTDTLAFITDASIELWEIDAVLHGATLNQISLRDIRVIGNHAVCEAQPDLDVRVFFGRAEEDDIAQAFAGTM